MVAIAPDEVNEILIPPFPTVSEQKRISDALRRSEDTAAEIEQRADAVQ